MANEFLKAALTYEGSALTENGATSYATTGSDLIDQFMKNGCAQGRDIDTVWCEQSRLWNENPLLSVKFIFYLRMITRTANIADEKRTEKTQRGQGLRDEPFKRLLWLATFHPETFYKNIWLLPIVGSWKDIWTLMSMDENNILDRKKMFELLTDGLSDKTSADLVKKYMPRIRSGAKCHTDKATNLNLLAKEFAKHIGWTYSEYRRFKATGKAHNFQRIISNGLYSKIKWNEIPGKALLNLVSGEFLTRHNLETSYMNWLKTQPLVKFNGYPYELGAKLRNTMNSSRTKLHMLYTIDKQFDNLIATAKSDSGAIKGNVLCALDTSGSMSTYVNPQNTVTAFDVCISLGIFFSELNTGAFHNTVAMFNEVSSIKKLSGNSFSEKWKSIMNTSTAWGSTNFISLINLLCDIRRDNPNIPLSDYPDTILVISDMQFNPTLSRKSNLTEAKELLKRAFSEEYVNNLKFVWWYCTGRNTSDFPATMNHGGNYFFSGFDGSVISFLLGGDEKESKIAKTSEEIVKEALSQELLDLISL